jgi:hypothetical protein
MNLIIDDLVRQTIIANLPTNADVELDNSITLFNSIAIVTSQTNGVRHRTRITLAYAESSVRASIANRHVGTNVDDPYGIDAHEFDLNDPDSLQQIIAAMHHHGTCRCRANGNT